MDNNQLKEFLAENGYSNLKEIEGRGMCGLTRMLYTTGLCYNLTKEGLEGRYCYENKFDAVKALEQWDGKDDPPGQWIKHKGGTGEYSNPNRE